MLPMHRRLSYVFRTRYMLAMNLVVGRYHFGDLNILNTVDHYLGRWRSFIRCLRLFMLHMCLPKGHSPQPSFAVFVLDLPGKQMDISFLIYLCSSYARLL